MSKIVELSNGVKVDFNIMYPPEKILPINHMDGYDPEDDIYDEVTEEEKEKYGLQKI